MARGFDRLFAVLDERVGPAEPPARLHGDLWGGNVIVDGTGAGCLIDPAVYGGHREIDLAMMRLFGGFGHHVFAAYEEAWPLSPATKNACRSINSIFSWFTSISSAGRTWRRQSAPCLQ